MKLTKTEFKILELFDTFTIGGRCTEHALLGKLYQVDYFAIGEFVGKQIHAVVSRDMVEGILEEMEYAGALVSITVQGNKYYTAVREIKSNVIYDEAQSGAVSPCENQ